MQAATYVAKCKPLNMCYTTNVIRQVERHEIFDSLRMFNEFMKRFVMVGIVENLYSLSKGDS